MEFIQTLNSKLGGIITQKLNYEKLERKIKLIYKLKKTNNANTVYKKLRN
jgi:hypothetical protein